MHKKWLVVVLLVLVVSLVALAACTTDTSNDAPAGGDTPPVSDQPAQPQLMSLATASLGGAYYIIGSAISEIVTQNVDSLQVNAVVAEGSVGNPKLIASGEADLAMTSYYQGMKALAGTDYDQVIELAGICPLQLGILQITTTANSSINTMADLKGKSGGVGPAGGGGLMVFQTILPYWGLSLEKDIIPSYISYADGTDALKDGNVDFNMPHGAPPLEANTTLAATASIKIISMEEDKVAQVLEDYPYFERAVIPAGTYEGLDTDVISIGLRDILVVPQDMDEETVYQITKALYENIETLRAAHSSIKDLSFENYKDSVVPLHPGAKRFYDEMDIAYE